MNKAYILQEIKRIAEENGGIPPGIGKFEAETRIGRWVWQKYWARWSEAVQETGLAPNQKTEAYDESKMLEQYAKLAQKLGRLPSYGDLKVQANNDSEFPRPGTFHERLGRKRELIQKLNHFSEKSDVFEKVTQWCIEYLSATPVITDSVYPRSSDLEDGCVYLIKSGRFYKIGRANSVGRREYELKIQLPEKAKTVHVILTDDPSGIEAYWHNRFAAKRKNGEWFELSAEDIQVFKRRKFM